MKIPKPGPRRPVPPAPRPFRLSRHAVGRAAEMALTMDQIAGLIDDPHIVAEHDVTSKYRDTNTVLHMRGDHTAVLDTDSRTVVTFLYRWREGWQDSEQELGEGREVRADSHLPCRR